MTFRIIFAFCAFALSACATMKPDDNLQKVFSGDIFGGSKSNPADERKIEQAARENERTMPRKEEEKGVGLKMSF